MQPKRDSKHTGDRSPPAPDPASARYAFVDAVVSAIAALQRLSLYGPLLRTWARKEDTNRRRAQVAPAYVLGWLLVDLAMLLSSRSWLESSLATVAVVAIAGYRFLDIVLYQLRLMLSRGPEQTVLAAFDRSLILLAFNVVELSLLSGIWLRAAGLANTTGSWFAGFLLTTLMATPSRVASLSSTARTEVNVATVATICGALVLLLGGLTLLIGLIGQKFHEFSE
jgi:hypothetical protein